MKFRNCWSKVAAAALVAALLTGCDSIKDVRTEPFTDIPQLKALLSGTVTGLGTARPVALSYNGSPNCLAPDPDDPSSYVPSECKFYGAPEQNEVGFSFGSFEVGMDYNITVRAQPYGKICSVANGNGTVGSGSPPPVVTCIDDPAVPRHNLTVNLSTAAQAEPNLWLRLVTEDGTQLRNATGVGSVTFEDVLLDSATNLPAFSYQVTAYTEDSVGGVVTPNLCTFTPTANINQGGENKSSADAIVVPTEDITVTVNACAFTVSATVQYNGTPAQTLGAGLELGLRNHLTGQVEQTLPVAAFTTGTNTVSFAAPLRAHSKAIYELVVTNQPAGQHCIVAGNTTTNADTTSATAGVTSNIVASTAGAVMLVDPANTDWWAYASRMVRCRAIPAPEAQLTGTYQMDAREGFQENTNPPRPYGRPREFLTFFADGTFMYGINMNTASSSANSPNSTFPSSVPVRNNFAASSGVVHGFYAYNTATNSIAFTILTATNTNPASRGLNGMPGFAQTPGVGAATGSVTATNVAKTPAPDSTLSMTFTSGASTRLWTMSEPESIPGELTGTWVTEDHRRVFTYTKGQAFSFHMGVNGLANLQDACFLVTDDSTQSGGVITRHSGSASVSAGGFNVIYTCAPGIINPGAANTLGRNPDLPHYAPKNSRPNFLGIGPTTPRIVPGFNGRFPGSALQLDNRPGSPVQFQVTAGNPDTLTVQETLNGTPVNAPIVFVRERAN